MQYHLDGTVLGSDGKRRMHRIEITVTGVTKVIDGVAALLIFERDFSDGRMAESELFFVAQDSRGNIWNMGEYPEIYDTGGQLLGAPATWLSGTAGAKAGVEMPGTPGLGDPPFTEGVAPEVNFLDCGQVYQVGQRVCVHGGCHDGVLVIDEYAPLNKKEGHQRKFYAPNLGQIKVAAVGGADPEELELTMARRLCAADFAPLQDMALAEDARALKASKDVFGSYPPAKPTLTPQLCVSL